jgi:hypothetical protein
VSGATPGHSFDLGTNRSEAAQNPGIKIDKNHDQALVAGAEAI